MVPTIGLINHAIQCGCGLAYFVLTTVVRGKNLTLTKPLVILLKLQLQSHHINSFDLVRCVWLRLF